MAFISNRDKEGIKLGASLRLTRDIDVLKGTFTKGSSVVVCGLPDPNDYRQEFLVRDRESGEALYLSPILGGYEPE